MKAKLATAPPALETIWRETVAALGQLHSEGHAIWHKDKAIAIGEAKANATIAGLRQTDEAEKAAAKAAKEVAREQHAIITRFYQCDAVAATMTKAEITQLLEPPGSGSAVLAEFDSADLCGKLKTEYKVVSPTMPCWDCCLGC